MRRVTFTRVYRMYQPGETAGFSDSEAASLIPAFGYDADGPDPQEAAELKAARAAEKQATIDAAAAEAAKVTADKEAAKVKADAEEKAKAEAEAKAAAEAKAQAEADAKSKGKG